MSMSHETPYEQGIRTIRTDLRNDLERFAELDPLFYVGYVTAWLAGNLDVDVLARLVDELDDTVRVNGHRLLDRPGKRVTEL
jgi:hypothetical protein